MCIVKCYKRSDSIFVSDDLINIMLPPSSEAPKWLWFWFRRHGHSIDDGEDETPICEVCVLITRCCRVAAAADGDATTHYSRK
ncbi:hypothetical protein H5410_059638 [Solanum commersonii]|uniref:Uncharacterized protein n=1 Tax=Solanum commersonii TaxID=4109 RepID=A0A9J5W3J4_SOLCO|nr:hypothetical protein H5410_059638 [Solanum commersonii]